MRLGMKTARQIIDESMSEQDDFMPQVIELAELLGWKYYHTHDSRRSPEGFPDLVLARDRVIYAELKSEKSQPSFEQWEWLLLLQECGEETYLWRPSDWDELLAVLQRVGGQE